MTSRFFRWAFHEFYNRFAFTYDGVSAIVSRGDWRKWTTAALPFVRGPRVLEVAFGTGNLELGLWQAGYHPVAVDLSPYMIEITARKLRARFAGTGLRLARADVCALPFDDRAFSTVVMTFPPGFVYQAQAMAELYRVLEIGGALVWVDAAFLDERDAWGRFLNRAFRLTGTGPKEGETASADAVLARRAAVEAWDWRRVEVPFPRSRVQVWIAVKRAGPHPARDAREEERPWI